MTRILLTGGGSGGHVYPLLAVAESLRKTAQAQGLDLDLRYMGPRDNYSELIAKKGISMHRIAAGKIRRYASGILDNILDIPKIIWGLIQAWWKMFYLMPDVVFSKGGPGAFAVALAAWFYRVPVVIHDSDAVPGLTNLLSARFARRIAVSFETAKKYFHPAKTVLTGNPVRAEFLANLYPQEQAKQALNFKRDAPLVLVIGGSQGAERLNDFMILALKEILPVAQVLHQTGRANYMEVKNLSQVALAQMPVAEEAASRYRAVPYFEDDLGLALAAADVVLARPGAGSIFEIAAFSKPAILVPIAESASDHQRANAYEFAATGAAVVIEESNLQPTIFLRELKNILDNPDKAAKMAQAAKSFSKPEAADALAKEVLNLA